MASTPNTMAGSVASQRKGDLRHYFGRSDGATAGRSGKRPRTIWETTIGSGSMEEAGLPSLSSADVTQMTTATLRDNINTAVDLELLQRCQAEIDRRSQAKSACVDSAHSLKCPISILPRKPLKAERTIPDDASGIMAQLVALGATPLYRSMPSAATSWIIHARGLVKVSPDAFRAEWELHPTEYKKVLTGRENRWSRFFSRGELRSFQYSGQKSMAFDVSHPSCPPSVPRFLDLANQLVKQMEEVTKGPTSTDYTFNACLVNWYEPSHTIAAHADDERQHKRGAPIFSFSSGGTRRFVVRSIMGGGPELEVLLRDGDLLVMGGTMQSTHKHEVPKIRRKDTFAPRPRINYTVRAFHAMYRESE